jgi:UTP--glucose-1-phosphate uridylyltransferase
VKTTGDLLQAQSDLWLLEKGVLVMNPTRSPDSYPVIKLGEEFQKLDDYEKRFKSIPNILELDHLTVSGNVTFGSNVTLKVLCPFLFDCV